MGAAVSCQSLSADGIHDSAFDGDTEAVRRWLAVGQNVNQANMDGDTALHMAVLNGQVGTARFLLSEAQAHPNAVGSGGKSPLHVAAAGPAGVSYECVRMLLEHGAAVNAVDHEGNAPLSIACVVGSFEVASLLLTAGADPNHRNARAVTPILVAAEHGHAEVVRELLMRGADPAAPPPGGMATPVIVVRDERVRALFQEHDRRKQEGLQLTAAGVAGGAPVVAVGMPAVGLPVQALPAPAPMMIENA